MKGTWKKRKHINRTLNDNERTLGAILAAHLNEFIDCVLPTPAGCFIAGCRFTQRLDIMHGLHLVIEKDLDDQGFLSWHCCFQATNPSICAGAQFCFVCSLSRSLASWRRSPSGTQRVELCRIGFCFISSPPVVSPIVIKPWISHAPCLYWDGFCKVPCFPLNCWREAKVDVCA